MSYAIKIESLSVEIDNFLILDNINLIVENKDFLGIIGPNGGGKTTLLKTLLGFIKPNKGKIYFFGETSEKSSVKIGYVPQHLTFDRNFPITVLNMTLSGRLGKNKILKRLNKNDIETTLHYIDLVGLSQKKDELIGSLSGGEKQRAAIARALTSEPQILLLDEPTSSIDIKTGENFFDLLTQLNKKITIILVSHDIGAVSKSVKKIACLNKRLYFSDTNKITRETLESVYNCPIEVIVHKH